MKSKIISDKYGNRIKVSEEDKSVGLMQDASKDKIKVSNKPGSRDSVAVVGSIKSKIDKKEENKGVKQNKTNELHICRKGIGSCQEKDDKSLWFYIGTYKIGVDFCPYCGYKKR